MFILSKKSSIKKHIATKSEDAEKSICKTVSRKDHDTEIRSVEDK